MALVEVLVKHKELGDERIVTYRAYQDTQYAYELIGEVDSEGNLVPGDPNLNPRHQKQAVNDVVRVVEGPSMEENQRMKEELMAKYAKPIEVKEVIEAPEQVKEVEKKKPGRPKLETV